MTERIPTDLCPTCQAAPLHVEVTDYGAIIRPCGHTADITVWPDRIELRQPAWMRSAPDDLARDYSQWRHGQAGAVDWPTVAAWTSILALYAVICWLLLEWLAL